MKILNLLLIMTFVFFGISTNLLAETSVPVIDESDPLNIQFIGLTEGQVLSKDFYLRIKFEKENAPKVVEGRLYIDGEYRGTWTKATFERYIYRYSWMTLRSRIRASAMNHGQHETLVNLIDETGRENVKAIRFIADHEGPYLLAPTNPLSSSSESFYVGAVDHHSALASFQVSLNDQILISMDQKQIAVGLAKSNGGSMVLTRDGVYSFDSTGDVLIKRPLEDENLVPIKLSSSVNSQHHYAFSLNRSNGKYLLSKLNSNGSALYTLELDGKIDQMEVDNEGSVYFSIRTSHGEHNLVKLDADGQTRYTVDVGVDTSDQILALSINPNGLLVSSRKADFYLDPNSGQGLGEKILVDSNARRAQVLLNSGLHHNYRVEFNAYSREATLSFFEPGQIEMAYALKSYKFNDFLPSAISSDEDNLFLAGQQINSKEVVLIKLNILADHLQAYSLDTLT